MFPSRIVRSHCDLVIHLLHFRARLAPVGPAAVAGGIMSTICKLVVRTRCEDLAAVTRDFLNRNELAFTESATEWPAAAEHENFQNGDAFPRFLSMKQVTTEVAELHFSSFAKLEELGSYLSKALRTSVIVNVYQSVSTASYWALHTDGRLLRALEAGDGEVIDEIGDRLPFESTPLGHDVSRTNEPCFSFDYRDQDRYNAEAGIPISVYQDYSPVWLNLNLVTPELQRPARPWWKFWTKDG